MVLQTGRVAIWDLESNSFTYAHGFLLFVRKIAYSDGN